MPSRRRAILLQESINGAYPCLQPSRAWVSRALTRPIHIVTLLSCIRILVIFGLMAYCRGATRC